MKRNVRTSVLLAASLGVFAVAVGVLPLPNPADAGTAAPVLDHFKCYQTTGPPVSQPVGLRDQFDATPRNALVLGVTRFCNPVEKTHAGVVTPIRNPDAHLKLYAIETTTAVSPRTVVVSNQFGTQQLRVTGPQGEMLAVPTQKLPHPPPTGLDHFKCYPATGPTLSASVRLRDQFPNTKGVAVRRPVLFCNPTEKIHGPIFAPITNPAGHLTCYKITPKPFSTNVVAINQFGTENLTVRDADLLCVPSQKLSVTPPP